MKLQVEYVPIGTIKPYKRNAKLHPQEQIEQIKNSMQEFGNIDPIGVWHNEIVEGHGRYEALKQMGAEEIPIIRLDDLTDEQRKAYALAHNKLTMNSDFDVALLDAELADIDTIDMELLGFGDQESEAGTASGSNGTNFSYHEQYGVIVMCKNEQEQEAIFNRLTEEGFECKVVAV